MKKIAIIQSSYIPWKGYFDIIRSVDEFVLLDDVQYTKRDWRNRNSIKTIDGILWLVIPVKTKGRYLQKINETEVVDNDWRIKHWRSILGNYSNARHFKEYKAVFENLYLNNQEVLLSKINYAFIREICGILSINTKISWSSDYCPEGEKDDRLIDICKKSGAKVYLSGPSAKDYISNDKFKNNGITLHYADYSGYPEYAQAFPPFEHNVSVIDLLFNEGPNAGSYMKFFK